MIRTKTFDATGVAPGGVLYAGDINAIEDAAAALSDLTQNLQVATLAVGEVGLLLLRYGAGEARLTGALRTDGIIRALGGLFAGTFTTTQRDAIVAPPYGLVVLNTTNNRWEMNFGSSGAPSWGPMFGQGTLVNSDIAAAAAIAVSKLGATTGNNGQFLGVAAGVPQWTTLPPGVLTGTIVEFGGPESSIPAGYLACDGKDYDQTVQVALYNVIGHGWDTFGGLAAPSAGRFRVPDKRGVGSIGNTNMGASSGAPALPASRISRTNANVQGSLLGVEYVTLAISQIPSHDHTAVTGTQSVDHTHSGTTASENANHTHSGTTGTDSVDHTHTFSAVLSVLAATAGGSGNYPTNPNTGTTSGVSAFHVHGITTGNQSANHQHTFTTGGASVSHTHTISAQGGGGSHDNVHPVAVVNYIIKT